MGAVWRMHETHAEACGEAFKEEYRLSGRHFTRDRKLPAGKVVSALVAGKGRSMGIEMRDLAALGVVDASRQAMLKARMKLDPEGIRHLVESYAAAIYAQEDVRTFRGSLLIAIDGTTINVPTSGATLHKWGTSVAKEGARPQAALRASGAWDVLNRIIVDIRLSPLCSGETSLLPAAIDATRTVAGGAECIFVMDRGYPSIDLVEKLSVDGVPFVMRASSRFLKEEFGRAARAGGDSVEEVALAGPRLTNYKRTDPDTYERLASRTEPLLVRLAIVDVGTGAPEFLVTNLPADFSAGDLAEIYRLRWGVETGFRFLKRKVRVEDFTGFSPILIEQDVYAAAYVLNAACDLANEADRGLGARAVNSRGHTMAVNRSFAIGVLKDMFLRIVAAGPDEAEELADSLAEDLRL